MNPSDICIVPVTPCDDAELLAPLERTLRAAFSVEVRVHRASLDAGPAFDSVRNQYNASSILLKILEHAPPGAGRLLGITDADLFVPVLTFIFGEAQYEGRGALVSTARLRAEFYGDPPDPSLLLERFLKEAVHELGHTYGLKHCFIPACVMNSSTAVEGIDEKSVLFCRRCRQTLARREAGR